MIHKSCFLCLCLLFARGVFGVDGDEMKSVSVMEGDSVSLHSDLTHIQVEDEILWRFGPQETRLAEIFSQKINIYERSKIFGDRLNLDSQTGSLTITNIRITDTGLYKLQIRSDSRKSDKTFSVNVYAPVPVPEISRTNNSSNCSSSSERSSVSKCVLLCSVMNVSHVSLSWYKGNSLLSSISVSDLNIRLSLLLEVEYQDTNTYRCVVSNPVSNQTQRIYINDFCQKCSGSRDFPVVIAVALPILIVAVAVAVAVYFNRHKCSPRNNVENQ